MKVIKPRAIKTLNDNEYIYVSRCLINTTMANIICSQKVTRDNHILLEIVSNAVEQEYETKRIIPYIKMSVKDVKACFPNYEKMPKGDFLK